MPHETAFQPPSRPLVAIAALAMVAAYANGLRGTFVMDDVPEIVNNEAIRTLWPPWVPMFEGGRLCTSATSLLHVRIEPRHPRARRAWIPRGEHRPSLPQRLSGRPDRHAHPPAGELTAAAAARRNGCGPALVVPLAAVTKARNACYDSRLARELTSGIHHHQGPAAVNWSPWEIFPPGPGHSSRSILRTASRARSTSPRASAAA